MKRFRRMLCLILVLVMLMTMFPTMRLTPAVHAEWGDGESCFVCDGYLDENNCCQGCGGVHAEDVNSDCYNAMHCKDCGECFLLVSGCAKCGRCEDCCGYRCDGCGDYFCDDQDNYCETCGLCESCAEDENLHCIMCMECCLGELCESCGLCVFCQEEMRSVGGGHCEVCDACLYDVYGDISEDNNCPVHGEDHCYACYEEFQCEQCGDCYAGEEDSLCQFCGLCPECCEQNSMDAGCASGEICVEDPDFEYHFCPNCEQCFCEVDYCDTCGEWCQECCDEERCSICDLCPNTYYGDLCDTCGAGGESLDEHEQYHMCEESRCGACGFCQTSLEDAFGYIECPCCGACPNECSCADDCEDCQCHQISCYASPYYTRDQMILSVTVLDGNEGTPLEDATVYFSHDKMSWHRLGETNAYGVAQGNVARVLKGDPASYNTSGWYVSVTNRKSSAAGLVLVGDVYYVPGGDKTVSFSMQSPGNYRASAELKLYATDYDPSIYYAGQYDVLLTMPKREVDGIPYSLSDYFTMNWSKGTWGITSYYTNQLTNWAWKDRVLDYFKRNQDYFGAYLLPYNGKSNLPSQNDDYYYAPLYHFEGNTMVGDYVSEDLWESIHCGFAGFDKTVGIQMLRFHDVPAGTYQLLIVLPECKLISRKVKLTFQDGGIFESHAYDHFKMRQAVRQRDLDKSYFRLGFMDQVTRRSDGGTAGLTFPVAFGSSRTGRAAFILTVDRATGRKMWAVNESFAWANDRNSYSFWVPRGGKLDYQPYILSYNTSQDKNRTLQSGFGGYYYQGGAVTPLEGSYTGLHLFALQNQTSSGNPDKNKYYKVRLFFGEQTADGSVQPMPDNVHIRFGLSYDDRSLVYDNLCAPDIKGFRAYQYGMDFTLPASCQLGALTNQFYYTEQTRTLNGGWIEPSNSSGSGWIDKGLVKATHAVLRGTAFVEGYGPIATTRGPATAQVSWDDANKTVNVRFIFTKLNRTGMQNGYGVHRVYANATLATKSKLDPADPYIYVNGKKGAIYDAVCGDEIEIRFTTAPGESVQTVSFVRSGSGLELKSVSVDPLTRKRTFVYTFTMGREDAEILVALGWPGGVSGYEAKFAAPVVNFAYNRYIGEPISISATVAGDAGSMYYGPDGWTIRGDGYLYMKAPGSSGYTMVEHYPNTHSMSYPVDTSTAGSYEFYFTYKGFNSAKTIESYHYTIHVMTPFQIDYAESELNRTIIVGDSVTLEPAFANGVLPDGVTVTYGLVTGQDVNGDGVTGDEQKLGRSLSGRSYTVTTTKDQTPIGTYLIRCHVRDKWGHSETLAYHVSVIRDNRYSRLKYTAAKPEVRCAVTVGETSLSAVSREDSSPALELTVEAGQTIHLAASFHTLPKDDAYYYQRVREFDNSPLTDEPVWLLPLAGKELLTIYINPRYNPSSGTTYLYYGTLNGWDGTYTPTEPGEYVLHISANNQASGFAQPEGFGTTTLNAMSCQRIFLTVKPQSNPFVDVKASAWYGDAVLWAVRKGITNGTDTTHFSPGAVCTRGQVVTFLWRAAGNPAPSGSSNPFTDVKPGQYYYDAVLWAVEQGITSGTSATKFSPGASCTRGHIVTFLYRSAGSPEVTGDVGFVDVEETAFYAKPVIWAVQNGITNGTDETHFSPKAYCTRAQVVTFLMRASELLYATVWQQPINELKDDQFLMYVEEKYTITGRGLVLTGRVANGSVRVGDTVLLRSYTSGSKEAVPYVVQVEGIEMFHKTLDEAFKGDNIGILLSGVTAKQVNRGDALVPADGSIKALSKLSVVTGTVTVAEDLTSSFGAVDSYQFYYGNANAGNVTGTVLALPDGPLAAGKTGADVSIGALWLPVVWYAGQELKIRLGGRNYGTFTIDRIIEADALRYAVSAQGVVSVKPKWAKPGETVTVSLLQPENWNFNYWTSSSSGVVFQDATALTTTFVMPANPVQISFNGSYIGPYLTAAEAFVAPPKAGETAGSHQAWTDTKDYWVLDTIWVDIEENRRMESDDTFIEGRNYGVRITLQSAYPVQKPLDSCKINGEDCVFGTVSGRLDQFRLGTSYFPPA